MPTQGQRHPGGAAFVHDFATVQMPVESAVDAFTARAHPTALAPLVLSAWEMDVGLLVTSCRGTHDTITATAVQVELNLRRSRTDAVIVNIKWRGNGWLPALDADLELVEFGRDRTHIHLMGRYELPSTVERHSNTGSLIQRIMVVVVRSFLHDLATLLETGET